MLLSFDGFENLKRKTTRNTNGNVMRLMRSPMKISGQVTENTPNTLIGAAPVVDKVPNQTALPSMLRNREVKQAVTR